MRKIVFLPQRVVTSMRCVNIREGYVSVPGALQALLTLSCWDCTYIIVIIITVIKMLPQGGSRLFCQEEPGMVSKLSRIRS